MTTARRKFMPVKEIARYMVQLLRGLAHLHKHKVVHCDVSPQNVFLRRDREVNANLWIFARLASRLDVKSAPHLFVGCAEGGAAQGGSTDGRARHQCCGANCVLFLCARGFRAFLHLVAARRKPLECRPSRCWFRCSRYGHFPDPATLCPCAHADWRLQAIVRRFKVGFMV